MIGFQKFHRTIMPSSKALHYALDRIEELDITLIAPQHGSILRSPVSQKAAIAKIRSLPNVGFDYFIEGQKNGKPE
jgi:hypothetical protein